MTTQTTRERAVDTLTDAELGALAEGAAWYAQYHQHSVPSADQDASAAACARREHFDQLYGALEKLGIRLRRPGAIRTPRN